MRYEGDAVQYSAFALVAIESVWPNPDGNELSPDDADLSLIDTNVTNYKSEARSGFSTLSRDVENERDYYEKQGYYKIIPLNVTAVRTNASENGSTFSVTFTLDDLLLVTEEGNIDSLRHATGLPFSTNDLVESDLQGALPQLFNPESENSTWRYVKDSELGLSRYRISGSNSSFNVEDLVDVSDTVTIWIYHDPQDFYLKDEVPDESYFDDSNGLMRFNDKISNVVGSADRRNQFSSDTSSFDETLLGNLGIINEFVSSSIETLLSSETEYEESLEQIPAVTRENIFDLLNEYTVSGTSGSPATSEMEKLVAYVDATFAQTSESSRGSIMDLIIKFNDPSKKPLEDGAIAETSDHVTRKHLGREVVEELVSKLLVIDESDNNFLFLEDVTQYPAGLRFSVFNRFEKIGIQTPDEIASFIRGLNMFSLEIDKKTHEYVTKYLTKKRISRSRQTFVNGRTTLINESHGETPYLALKGVISGVEVAVGAGEGSYLVTLTGKGYEKVLQDNEIFYEDYFYNSGFNTARTDYQTLYVNMSPPRAIQHVVSRWAAKQVLLGKQNSWTTAATNRFIYLEPMLNVSEEEEDEINREQQEGGENSPLGSNNSPIRGNFVLTEATNQLQIEQIRLFSPINYLDTTRVQEMARTLDRSYDNPQLEAGTNVAMELETRGSVMDNIRKLGGIAHFYQLFVDESGRLRYRLSFEAMERTPRPGYMPTIQDYDLLADGNVFSSDDTNLVTMVDVKPLVGQWTTNLTNLALVGRSVPEAGKVPLRDTGNIPPETLSPEFYRYGLRSLTVQDVYQGETHGAGRKAGIYRQFFGAPLKKASVRVRNNTSYRVGETVLVSLLNNKKRSRSLIDIPRMITWLKYIIDDEDLLKMYIGVDERILQRGKESFVLTSGEYNPFWDSGVAGSGANKYDEFNKNPHKYIAQMFLDTLTFIRDTITGVSVITPDYFPTVYWFYKNKPGGAFSWDENRVADEVILEAYELSLRIALGFNDAKDRLAELLLDQDNIGLINSLRFQNFRAASYYIESVSHNFAYGADATTSLGLNYGQDNLVIQDPINLLPIGFISLEKKMRIGYPSDSQKSMWLDYGSKERSALQNLYVEQFKEDDLFKRASFLYNSQYLRNSSNYMYELGVVREGLDAYVVVDSQNPTEFKPVDTSTTPDTPTQIPSVTSPADRTIRQQELYTSLQQINNEELEVAIFDNDLIFHELIGSDIEFTEDNLLDFLEDR